MLDGKIPLFKAENLDDNSLKFSTNDSRTIYLIANS